MKKVIILISVGVVLLMGYLAWQNPWAALYILIGIPIAIVLALVAVRLVSGMNGSQKPTATVSGPNAPRSTSSPAPGSRANWGWVSTALKWLLILGGIVLLVYGVIWLWGLSEPIRKSSVPILSAEKRARAHGYTYVTRQRGDIIREVVPEAGKVPVCAQNSAETYTLSEGDRSRVIEVPARCTPVIDPDYKLGAYLVQYKDQQTGEWVPTSTDYTAIRLRKQVSSEPCTITVQVWFVPFTA